MTPVNQTYPERDDLVARLEKTLIDGDYLNWNARVNAVRLARVVREFRAPNCCPFLGGECQEAARCLVER